MKKKINVLLKNSFDKNLFLPEGTVIHDLLEYLHDKDSYIAATVNNETTSLSYQLKVNSIVEFITNTCQSGMEVYRRSLSFLLEKVAFKLFPDRKLIIGHSLGPGYYFDLVGKKEVTEEEIKLIENEMKREVEENKPINRENINYQEALEHFKKTGRWDKYKLISGLNMSKLSIYRCEGFFQVFDLPLVNRTGVLNIFKLIYYPPGFILQFPKKSNPEKVSPFTEQKNIFMVYHEYKAWGKILNVGNVGLLNEIISTNKIGDFIQVAEALHTRKVINLADEIYKKINNIKLICIAGPSSSGKTTFSKRLAIQLNALGLKPLTISVDDYFIDRDKTPLDEKGKPNYETIDAINIDLFNEQLKDLLNGKEIRLPKYDFLTGRSTFSDKLLSIREGEIILIEGIHCLNEKLTFTVPKENKYKIYISVLTQMNIDNTNRIPTTDNRIIRRMVRDHKYRGNSALKTLQTWPSVRKGEEEFIFPFQNDADGYFNSALDYELALLKPYAESLLLQIKPFDKEYAEAVRLLRFLSYFLAIQSKFVPSTSLIREFIGGSFFSY